MQPDSHVSGADEAERLELGAVLSSQTFARSQRLVKLLEYISERHFHGQDDQVCEYAIATEVLGRSPGFDPAEDAIARVEIHRLRKKLRDYYATEGTNRPLKIIIPPGMYTPVFQQDGNAPARPANGKAIEEPAAATLAPPANGKQPEEPGALLDPAREAPPELPPSPLPSIQRDRKIRLFLGAAFGIVLAAAGVAAWRTGIGATLPELPRIPPPVVALPADNAIRIIAGYNRPQYIDHRGHTWLSDRFYEGGGQPGAPFRQFIARTCDPLLYQNGRIGVTAYDIPLQSGVYEMKLHFVEPVYGPGRETGGGENSRVFDILLNGKMLVDGFDIVSDAGGPNIADVRVFKDIQPGPDGHLRLGFHAKREQPLISALELEPAPPHRINPIRIVTQGNSVTDSQGQVWQADSYYMGGQPSNHWKLVSGTADADLFNNERYGHFSYAIPVAPGSYTVKLYFAETYWGPENLGGGGPGQRIFDVYCNGVALLRNFDIFKEAGGSRALVKQFVRQRPNAQGKLNLEFVPVSNYASVFAIEVLDEDR